MTLQLLFVDGLSLSLSLSLSLGESAVAHSQRYKNIEDGSDSRRAVIFETLRVAAVAVVCQPLLPERE